MAIVVTDDTVDDADAYFSTRLGSGAWIALDNADKKSALTTAANVLNQVDWSGSPQSAASAFPRMFRGSTVYVTPNEVLMAVYEEALHLASNPSLLMEEETIETLVLGPLSLVKIEEARLIPKLVLRLISAYTSSGAVGGNIWWRAN